MVLDEADQMLQLGFQEDVEEIMKAISVDDELRSQFIMFSATIPSWVRDVAKKYISGDHKYIDLVKDLKNKTAQNVQHLAINCPYYNRTATLCDILLCYKGLQGKAIVFTSTKADANQIITSEKMKHEVEVLHGDIA